MLNLFKHGVLNIFHNHTSCLTLSHIHASQAHSLLKLLLPPPSTSCSCSRCCFSSSKRSLFLASSARRSDTWRPAGVREITVGVYPSIHREAHNISVSPSLSHSLKHTCCNANQHYHLPHNQISLCQDMHGPSGQTFPKPITARLQHRLTSSAVINDVRS